MKHAVRPLGLVVLVAAVIWIAALSAQAAPIWEFKFNETGTSCANTGAGSPAPGIDNTRKGYYTAFADLHGADGGGVSGAAGDRAIDFSGLTTHGGVFPGYTYAPEVAIDNSLCGPIATPTTMTLSGWINAAEALPTNAYGPRIYLMGMQGYPKGWRVMLQTVETGKNMLALYAGNGSADAWYYFDITPVMASTDTNKWFDWAFTYDGTQTTNNLKLYMGTKTDAMQLVGTMNSGLGTLASGGNGFALNDNGNGGPGTFKGLQDNLRIDSAVLSMGELEAQRQADAVPEPATLSLLFMGALALMKRRS